MIIFESKEFGKRSVIIMLASKDELLSNSKQDDIVLSLRGCMVRKVLVPKDIAIDTSAILYHMKAAGKLTEGCLHTTEIIQCDEI